MNVTLTTHQTNMLLMIIDNCLDIDSDMILESVTRTDSTDFNLHINRIVMGTHLRTHLKECSGTVTRCFTEKEVNYLLYVLEVNLDMWTDVIGEFLGTDISTFEVFGMTFKDFLKSLQTIVELNAYFRLKSGVNLPTAQ